MALRLQCLGGVPDVVGGRGGGIRVGFDADDVLGDVPGALRGVLGAARDLLGRRTLLFDRGGDRGRDLIHLADDVADAADRVNGLGFDLLNVGNLLPEMSSVALAVWLASDLTSDATTASPGRLRRRAPARWSDSAPAGWSGRQWN